MKTTLYFILTLLTFVTFMFVPNSFAQDFRPIVRLIYFVPSDRQPQSDMDTKFDKLIKEVQQGYEGIMEAHGFDKKTFLFETDANGNAVVHTVNGQHTEKHYKVLTKEIWQEIDEHFDKSKDFHIVSIDIIRITLGGSCGPAGLARYLNSTTGSALMPASGAYFNIILAAHELGHVFGLSHDYRPDANVVESDIYVFLHQFPATFCAAEWLDVHRAFNVEQHIANTQSTFEMLPPSLVASPNVIRFRFKVTDPDGIHQVRLMTPESNRTGALLDCKNINGNASATVEFVTSSLTPKNEKVSIQMIDMHGNIQHSESYPTDVLSLLPPPETISIPDPNLAAAVRKALDLSTGDAVTQWDILRLPSLTTHSDLIKDTKVITGLEHATHLRYLDLWGNKIRDITPLTGLTGLWVLSLTSNQISDITPLTGLTQLRDLLLKNNQISDITPLTGLTNLSFLDLRNNQISDVSPLADLVNLKELHLEGNPIKNRKPLLELLRKNPDVKIYISDKNGHNKLLPVTLSHFRAEHSDAGVILKWTTESEIDNAGFYIYRSETKEGEFAVVNPTMIQGAGTTGERNEYTWTDTTAKPNTVYYYQIEDISHAGVRKQLATVRMRGLVSATGKLTTRWADLKTQN